MPLLQYLCASALISGPILRDAARQSQRYPASLRAMGFLVSQHGQLGAIPPPPCLSVSPLESMRSGGALTPHKTGISAILARYHMKTRPNHVRYPRRDTISKRYCAIWGGISHWASCASATAFEKTLVSRLESKMLTREFRRVWRERHAHAKDNSFNLCLCA